MDKFNDIAIFVQAAQTLSFSIAARQLGMSPSAVSKAVQRLEEHLKVRLFNRTTRSLSLTEDGSAFRDRCRRILDELEEAEQELGKSRSIPTGTLRLDLTVELGRLHIVPALPSFIAQYPELKLDVTFNNRMVDLVEEGIDAGVRVGSGADSQLILHRLATARLIVCAAPTYLMKYGEPKIPEDLIHHNCLTFVSPNTGRVFEWSFQRHGQQFHLPIDGNLRLSHGEALLEVALRGVGLVQLNNYLAGAAIAQGKLKPVLESYGIPGRPISVVYPQKRHLSAKVQAFIDFMSELMNQLRQNNIVE